MTDDPNPLDPINWPAPTPDHELFSLVACMIEWQNMHYGNTWTLPPEMRRAQAESWARAMRPTGDPRFD